MHGHNHPDENLDNQALVAPDTPPSNTSFGLSSPFSWISNATRELSSAAGRAAMDVAISTQTKTGASVANQYDTLARDLHSFFFILSTNNIDQLLRKLSKVAKDNIDDLQSNCLNEHRAANFALRKLSEIITTPTGKIQPPPQGKVFKPHSLQQTLFCLFSAYLVNAIPPDQINIEYDDLFVESDFFTYHKKLFVQPPTTDDTGDEFHDASDEFDAPEEEDNRKPKSALSSLFVFWLKYSDQFKQHPDHTPISNRTASAFFFAAKLFGDRAQQALTDPKINLAFNQRLILALFTLFSKRPLDALSKAVEKLTSLLKSPDKNSNRMVSIELLSCFLSDEYLDKLLNDTVKPNDLSSSTNRLVATSFSLVGSNQPDDSRLVKKLGRAFILTIASVLFISSATSTFVLFLTCELSKTMLAIYFASIFGFAFLTQAFTTWLILKTINSKPSYKKAKESTLPMSRTPDQSTTGFKETPPTP